MKLKRCIFVREGTCDICGSARRVAGWRAAPDNIKSAIGDVCAQCAECLRAVLATFAAEIGE